MGVQISLGSLVVNEKYTKEIISREVKTSKNWTEVSRKLGTVKSGYIKKRAVFFGIDFSHFTGKVWNKGKRFPKKTPTVDFLKLGSNIPSARLRKRLLNEGLKEPKCEMCGLISWLGEPADLELDHINSIEKDNRLENLQILCPNCHALKTRKIRNLRKLNYYG